MVDKKDREIWQVTGLIAEQLGESKSFVRGQIKAILIACGIEQSLAWLVEAQEIESHGGLMVENGLRRRTPGGVFFWVARSQMPEDLRNQIFVPYGEQRKRRKEAKAQEREINGDSQAKPPPPPQTAHPAQPVSLQSIAQLLERSGEATSVKITLMGRPGRLEHRGDLVVTTMTSASKPPSLPKGLPPLPETPTTYVVYIAAKQWRKVEEALTNAEDSLIIEGHCVFDPHLGQIAVYTSSVISKLQQRAKWEDEGKSVPSPVKPSFAPVVKSVPDPGLQQKLAELQAAEQAAVERVNVIKAAPTSQQQGLFSAMRELQRLRDELRALQG